MIALLIIAALLVFAMQEHDPVDFRDICYGGTGRHD